ncbi:hypothetical protein C1N58_22330 (plasmid) [Pantoea sp. SGAir0180]
MSTAQLIQHHPKDANALFKFDADYCPPEGESLAQATQRVISFLQDLQGTKEHLCVCIVTHGMSVRECWQYLKKGLSITLPGTLTQCELLRFRFFGWKMHGAQMGNCHTST